jgi:hypothetical protein
MNTKSIASNTGRTTVGSRVSSKQTQGKCILVFESTIQDASAVVFSLSSDSIPNPVNNSKASGHRHHLNCTFSPSGITNCYQVHRQLFLDGLNNQYNHNERRGGQRSFHPRAALGPSRPSSKNTSVRAALKTQSLNSTNITLKRTSSRTVDSRKRVTTVSSIF